MRSTTCTRDARTVGAVLLLLSLSIFSHAATYTWDVDPGTAGIQNDSGDWNTTTANWYDGANHNWNNLNNDTAGFSGFGGPRNYTITLTEPITVGGITWIKPSSGVYGSYNLAASGTGALNLGLADTPLANNYNLSPNTVTISAPITGNGMVLSGVGPITLSGTNSYTGTTVVNSAGITLANYNALGTNDGGTTINSGGRLGISNSLPAGTLNEPFTLNGGGLHNLANGEVTQGGAINVIADSTILVWGVGSRELTATGGVDIDDGITLTVEGESNGTMNFSSTISGSGTLLLQDGKFSLNSTSAAFTGQFTVDAGATTSVTVDNTFGNGAVRVNSGGTVRVLNDVDPGGTGYALNGGTLFAFQNNMTIDAPINLLADSVIRGHNFGSGATLTGSTIDLGDNTLTLLNATSNPGYGNVYMYDKITGAGNVVMGNGSDNGEFWFYNTTSDYTGTTTVTSGRFRPTENGVVPLASDVVVNSPQANGLYINNFDLTLGSLSGSGNVNTATSGGLIVGGNNNSTEFSGAIAGGGSLTKTGDGDLTLSGTNTYTGGTTVNSGGLLIDGSITSDVSVQSGGTVGGSGTIGSGLITVQAGGTLAPGASPGTLTVDQLLLESGSVFEIELFGTAAGSEYDQVIVTGDIDIESGTILDLALNFNARRDDTFTIVESPATSGFLTYGSTVLGEGDSFNVGAYVFGITYAGGTGNDIILNVLIPEPASFALLILLSSGLLLRRHRRK